MVWPTVGVPYFIYNYYLCAAMLRKDPLAGCCWYEEDASSPCPSYARGAGELVGDSIG